MRRLLLLLLFLLVVGCAYSQVSIPYVLYVATDPSGACGNGITQYNYTTGNFWGCLNGVWTLITGSGTPPPPVPGFPANQIISGCGVQYTSGLSFTIGACTYQISGQTYNSALTTVTLAAADPTNPRLDTLIVDVTSTASVLTGTPAATPVAPTVDPSTQLPITVGISIPANATTPAGVAATTIYDENTEWTATCTANLNCASTNNPYHLTKDIEATTAVLTNNVSLVKPAAGTVDLATVNSLVFYIRSKAQFPTGNGGANAARRISIWWQNGSTQKGNQVVLRDGVFGFTSATINAYQQISIPVSLFNINGIAVTTLVIQVSGNSGSSSIGFYLDWITLQSGFASAPLPTTLMNFRGTWNSTAAYNPNDTVVSSGTGYVALLANTNVAVTTAATWAPLAPAATQAFANMETPSGTINGSNVTFTLAHTPSPSASLLLFLNGVEQLVTQDYTIATATITFVNAPNTGATLVAFYQFQGSGVAYSTFIGHGLSFTIGDPSGSALLNGQTDYVTVPFACTLKAWNLLIDAGTVTVKFWKIATGTAIPTVTNSISTSGVSISSGTAIHSATMTDFTTTAVAANDIVAMNITAVATAKFLNGVLECDQ